MGSEKAIKNTDLHSELVSIDLSELLESESPSVETRSETDVSDRRIDHDSSHWSIVVTVCGNDNVDVLHDTSESLEEFLLSELQLKKSTIHLVHEQDRLDTLSNGLAEYGLSLYAHT